MNKYYMGFGILVTPVFLVYCLYSTNTNFSLHSFKHNYLKLDDNTYINDNSTKVILYWNIFHLNEAVGLGLGREIFANCPIKNCLTTWVKELKPVEYFDAIMFHANGFKIDFTGMPERRSKSQKYIFFTWESAFNSNLEPHANRNFYNWTMTVKRNSDIYYPYGILVKQNTSYMLPSVQFIRRKKKKVAWFASNCITDGAKRRRAFVEALEIHIPIDTYGSCGTLMCPHSKYCYNMIERTYKFYLSFENSFCPDYVTEKLFNLLNYNIIPVVWGDANYTQIVPEKVVINAREYKDLKQLVDYLLELDKNHTKYLEYFEWKKNFVVKVGPEFALCQICKKLNEPLQYSNYEDIKTWLYDKCTILMN